MRGAITRRQALAALLGACSIPLVGALPGCSSQKNADSSFLNVSDSAASTPAASSSAKYGFGVSSDSVEATKIGMDILSSGGNAVDAAVAVSYALGVAQPYGSGIGGGGAMLVYDVGSKKGSFLDYYDAAPSSFNSAYGQACIPGFVAGLETAHKQWGKESLPDLIQPAIDLAENGVTVSPKLATMLLSYGNRVSDMPCFFSDEGDALGEGDTLVQKELADTLKKIKDGGASAFYGGDNGNDLAQALGCTRDDLMAYAPSSREPAKASCYGYEVYAAPAPFAGVTTIQYLELLEAMNAPAAQRDPDGYLAALQRASSLASSAYSAHIGDPAFVQVDESDLVSNQFVSSLLSNGVAGGYGDDEEGISTTAFSVVDQNGLIVSVTNTIGNFFGCGVNLNGFSLNNHMTSFSAVPVNAFAPCKRPRSHISPSVAVGDELAFAIGTPGGNRIPKLLASVLHDVLFGGEKLQAAVDKNRVCFVNDIAYAEQLSDRDDLVPDSALGNYSAVRKGKGDFFGAVQACGCSTNGKAVGANDSRRDGSFESKK